MSKAKHTQGTAVITDCGYCVGVDAADGISTICEMRDWMEHDEMAANADLICDAFNTTASTGRPPSQLAAEREALVAAAEDALSGWRYIRKIHGDLSGVGWDRVENALRAILARVRAQEPKP